MIITPQQLITIIPSLIVGLTVIVVMLLIAWRRNHVLSFILSVTGLNLALFSLYFVAQTVPIDVTPLLRIDNYSIFYTGLVILTSLAICTFAYPWLAGYSYNCEEFYLLVLIATLGGIILTSANHLASLFLGIELISLPLFGLVGYAYQQRLSLEASIKYTILSAVASAFILFGMALVYADSGNLSFVMLGKNLNYSNEPLMLAGLGMMIVGLGFKLSLVPFHLWTPDVYQGAPSPVSTFLATASKIAIFSGLMRLFIYTPLTEYEGMRTVLAIIAVLSMLFGNLMAINQINIKRMLGYSSIAHLGYLLVALIDVHPHHLSMEAVGVYLVGYIFSSLGIFGVVNLMSSPYCGSDADSLYSYRGLFWHRPILAAVMTVMLLSLAGIPMTLGFIGKFYVIVVGVSANLWWLTGSVVVGSAIGLYYYLRITISLYLNPPEFLQRNTLPNWGFTMGGVLVLISTILVFVLGIYPQPLISLIKLAQPLIT